MLHALRNRQISAKELLDLHLQQISLYNVTLNAIVTPNYDEAKNAAALADETYAKGEELPLLGLPITIKDSIYVKGLPTTGGVVERAAVVEAADAPLVSRIRAAGAIILGKTNVPTYVMDWQSNNPLFGRTNNPWNLAYTPGGSTGGGAAAIAAGLTSLEFGSGISGSLRQPAACCGVYGHKPSESAVTSYGHLSMPDAPNPTVALFTQGPIARYAEDLELALDVISGPAVGEDIAWNLQIPPARHSKLTEFRVAIMPAIPWLPVDGEILGALDDLATKLGHIGVQVQEIQPEILGDMRNFCANYLSIYYAASQGASTKEERQRQAAEIRMSSPQFEGLACAAGLEANVATYILWFTYREQYRAAFRGFFKEWDILLSPVTMVNAFAHMDGPMNARHFKIEGQIIPYGYLNVYPSLCNLTGHPGTAFPIGFTHAGLPIGLQAIAPYLEDRTAIRFAGLVGKEFGGFHPPPGFISAN